VVSVSLVPLRTIRLPPLLIFRTQLEHKVKLIQFISICIMLMILLNGFIDTWPTDKRRLQFLALFLHLILWSLLFHKDPLQDPCKLILLLIIPIDLFIIPTVLLVDDLEMYRTVTNVVDCQLLQCDTDTAHNCCLDNNMRTNSLKTTAILYSWIYSINSNYKLWTNYLYVASIIEILETCYTINFTLRQL
jgi:hypothetical protein